MARRVDARLVDPEKSYSFPLTSRCYTINPLVKKLKPTLTHRPENVSQFQVSRKTGALLEPTHRVATNTAYHSAVTSCTVWLGKHCCCLCFIGKSQAKPLWKRQRFAVFKQLVFNAASAVRQPARVPARLVCYASCNSSTKRNLALSTLGNRCSPTTAQT